MKLPNQSPPVKRPSKLLRYSTTMKLPNQSPPVKRPHFIQPHTCVDVTHGRPDDLLAIRMDLLHGANYNDPAPFQYPGNINVKMSRVSLFL